MTMVSRGLVSAPAGSSRHVDGRRDFTCRGIVDDGGTPADVDPLQCSCPGNPSRPIQSLPLSCPHTRPSILSGGISLSRSALLPPLSQASSLSPSTSVVTLGDVTDGRTLLLDATNKTLASVVNVATPVVVRTARLLPLIGLFQWLMDHVRYFQDDELLAEQIMQCKEAFSAFDKSGSGTIPVKNLKEVMRHLGLNPTENEIINIMADLDLDSAGKIKLNDFVEVMLEKMRQMDTEDEIRKVFRVFDKDGNGLLSAAELKYMMTNMGHKFTDEEVDELLQGADVNGDGHLNYEEFVKMLLS